MLTQRNTFFTKYIYENEIALEANDVLISMIYEDGIFADEKLRIEFAFVTDERWKAVDMKQTILTEYPLYLNIHVEEANGYWEIRGTTSPVQMHIEEINYWNVAMWDLGYECDCKLDGWTVCI